MRNANKTKSKPSKFTVDFYIANNCFHAVIVDIQAVRSTFSFPDCEFGQIENVRIFRNVKKCVHFYLMSDTVVLFLSGIAAFVLFLVVWKIVKTIVIAAVVAVIACATLYFFLPRLENQKGIAGDAARKTQKIIKEVKENNKDLTKQMKSTAESAKKILDSAKEKTKDAVKKAEEAADQVKQVQEETEKLRKQLETP